VPAKVGSSQNHQRDFSLWVPEVGVIIMLRRRRNPSRAPLTIVLGQTSFEFDLKSGRTTR
jgi:hypothetical protein